MSSALRPTKNDIQRWLVDEVARRTSIPLSQVDPTQPFSTFNLDSMEGVNLAGALEDFLGVELEPTLVWDFPTIDKLSRHLASELAGGDEEEAWKP